MCFRFANGRASRSSSSGCGDGFGAVFPKVAGRIEPPLSRIFEIGLVVVAVLLIIGTYSLLLKMDAWSYVVMIIFIVVNVGLGHVLGPRDAQERTTLATESGERNTGWQ